MQHRYFHSRSSSHISNAYSCEYNYPQYELEEGNHFKWNRILSIKLLVVIIFIKQFQCIKLATTSCLKLQLYYHIPTAVAI